MRKITVVFGLFLATICVQAQSFKLYEVVDYAQGDEIADGAELVHTCHVSGTLVAGDIAAILENTSNEGKTVVCERHIIRLVEGAETEFCWGACTGPETSIMEMPVDAMTQTNPIDFITHYSAPCIADSSIVRYVFYDKADRNDSISLVFKYVTPSDLRISDYGSSISLSVYPNPTVDYLYLEMNDLQPTQAAITIYDGLGRMVKTQMLTSNSTKIDVTNLEQGIYYLQIGNDNKTVGLRRVVKE